MLNLAAVKAKQVEVVAKAKGRAAGQAAKAKDRAQEAKKSIMGTHLTHNPLKDQGLADQSGAPPRDANPSIGAQKSPETQAKASDLVEDLAYSAIILVVDTK
jgi:hypothetical protein